MLKGLLSVDRSRCLRTSIKLHSRFFSTCNQLRENRVRCGIDPAMRGVGLPVPKTAWRGGGKVSGDKIATSSFDFRLAQGCCYWHFDPNASNLLDRKSTRLNSSHGYISYAVFCLKKKKKKVTTYLRPYTNRYSR